MSIIELIVNLFKKNSDTLKTIQVNSPTISKMAEPIIENNKVAPTTSILLNLNDVLYKESPNKSNRKDQIRGIVLHHTGPGTFNSIVDWLCNPDAKASAHYVVGLNGELNQLVNTTRSAWHAGTSKYLIDGEVRDNLNNCTIGIEICNAGVLHKGEDGKFYYESGRNMKEWKGATPIEGSITYPSGNVLKGYFAPYPEKQISKVIELCKALVAKYPNIEKEDIITHYQIATPEGRKNDPFGLDVGDIINKIFDES
jgi:N-acetylmuramoyl-L-alanine amidase